MPIPQLSLSNIIFHLSIVIPGDHIVTAGTLYKIHFFAGDKRLKLLQDLLLERIPKHGWTIQARAVFANHYHLIASAPERESSFELLIKELHSKTAREVNQLDEVCGRQVWYQY
jgi:putative transposase